MYVREFINNIFVNKELFLLSLLGEINSKNSQNFFHFKLSFLTLSLHKYSSGFFPMIPKNDFFYRTLCAKRGNA